MCWKQHRLSWHRQVFCRQAVGTSTGGHTRPSSTSTTPTLNAAITLTNVMMLNESVQSCLMT
eukprot:3936783-Rhodomonas_salina.1